jgi:hypothetical protein
MKYFLPPLFIVIALLLPQKVSAADMVLQHLPASVAQQQQFYVDVALDPQNQSYNGIQGSVSFSADTLSLVRAETGSSLVSYFIDPPTAKNDTVTFSGIIVGGFNGLINPFDMTRKSPGEIMRLVFVATSPGAATVTTRNSSATLNDGLGTLQQVADTTASFNVTNAVAPSVYNTADTTPPTISASVVRDPNLYDGRYALLFSTVDKESGIDHVELREGNGPWLTIQSPYLLQDQSRKSILSLRAYDVAGNVTNMNIVPTAVAQSGGVVILILLLILCIILYVIYKKFKNKHGDKKTPQDS